MPMENFISARVESPKKYDKFRYGKDVLGRGIDVVYGIKDNKTEIQAIRFDKEKFTKEEVKKWMKNHKKKFLSIESMKDPEKLINEIRTGKTFREIILEDVLNNEDIINDEEEENKKEDEPNVEFETDGKDVEEPKADELDVNLDNPDQEPIETEPEIPANTDTQTPEIQPNINDILTMTDEVSGGNEDEPFQLEKDLKGISGVIIADLEEVLDGGEHYYYIQLNSENKSVAKEYSKYKITSMTDIINRIMSHMESLKTSGKVKEFTIVDTPMSIDDEYYNQDHLIMRVIL